MVTMNKPSPIQVGREFVRQYYTLLNKAPELLYRFYGISSSYVHGGRYYNGEPEQPIIGQSAIHQKIDSLKFHDCHTKIRQVDAHSTIGSGVVVQVTGELSNSGQPLRRFMQTFVLAPQGDNPFKFYVHNDIFRYQDEVFNEDGPTEHSEDEGRELEEDVDVTEEIPEAEAPNSQDNYFTEQLAQVDLDNEAPALTNGIEQPFEATVSSREETPPPPEPSLPTPRSSPPPEIVSKPVEAPSPKSQPTPPEKRGGGNEVPEEPAMEEIKNPRKVFSWADLASKNTPASRSNNQQPPSSVKVNKVPPKPPSDRSVHVSQKPEPVEASAPPPRPARGPKSNQRPRDDDKGGFGDKPEGNRRGRESTGVRYPDNQQVFIGNLPHDIADSDLKEHFAEFGEVLEIKINHSQSNNPSFGFVIFEDPKSVEQVLQLMPTNYKNNYRINIEEKKQRNPRDGNRRGGDPRRGGVGDSRGGRRGPPAVRRDRQGSREGPRSNYHNGSRR